ncbi:SDR family oxidoreductase [Microbacterium sp. TWP3-1-2b2]|uniref:SDR family oxidoreductase n=1 Tax=Microbacterium sp. TWP3-1-2b2 TaxID=2804651 RepID=UPI003CED4CE1
MRINGNTIFVPGATSGIGLALALRLHDAGNQVIIGGRRTELLDEIAAEHPGIDTVRIDTTDAASIADAASEVISRHPDLNVLVPMAGIMRVEDWTSPGTFLEDAEATVTTNLLGPIRLISAFIEHLLAQPDATIMTVSSGLAFAPLRFTPTYNATKAAIHQLSETLRLQLADSTVRVVELVPPSVQTELMPGHQDEPSAMPLGDYIDETMVILQTQPDVTEVQVERVKFLRYGEARGDQAQVIAVLNGFAAHAAS